MKSKLALVFLAAMTLSATAQLDGLYYVGGTPPWPAVQFNTNSYVALAPRSGVVNQFFAARAGGGVDLILNSGSWVTFPIPAAGGNYRALAVNNGVDAYVFAAKVGGGVDAVYFDFSGDNVWESGEININSFVSLANVSSANQFMGVRSDGRLEFTYYKDNVGPWTNYIVADNTDLYTRVIYDPMNGGGLSVYALRADGGIDRVTWNGSAWETTVVDHSRVYVAITAEVGALGATNWVYGATATGLYDIVDSGSGFTAYLINANSYKTLEYHTGTSHQLLAARADGSGLDAVYFNGSIWTSYQANPNNYDLLLRDAFNGNLYAAAPVAATAAPVATGVELLLDGNISITATGAVGTAWSLHATDDLTQPRPWPVIQSDTITSSPFQASDLTATNYPRRFYQFSTP